MSGTGYRGLGDITVDELTDHFDSITKREYYEGRNAPKSPAPKAEPTPKRVRPRSQAWMDDAACKGTDPNMFYPVDDEGAKIDAVPAEVLALCRDCPVRRTCLNFALREGEKGIWAATTEEQRSEMRKRRGITAAQKARVRGRPA